MSRHPIDLFSLGAGVMFSLFALGYLLVPASMSVVVVLPLMLIGLGGFGIAAGILAQRRGQAPVDGL